MFDVSGVVETPVDIDPLEPVSWRFRRSCGSDLAASKFPSSQVPGTEAWETPLDQIPNHQEVQKQLEDKKVVNKMLCTPQYF